MKKIFLLLISLGITSAYAEENIVLNSALGYVFNQAINPKDIDNEEIKNIFKQVEKKSSKKNESEEDSFRTLDILRNSIFKMYPKLNIDNWEAIYATTNNDGEIIKIKAEKRSTSDMNCYKEAKRISKSLNNDFGIAYKSSFSYYNPYYSLRSLSNGEIEINCKKELNSINPLTVSINYIIK